MVIDTTQKADLRAIYDFCNGLLFEFLNVRDNPELSKFRVIIDKGLVLCMIKNKDNKLVRITFKGDGNIIFTDGEKEKIYKLSSSRWNAYDGPNIASILGNDFHIQLDPPSCMDEYNYELKQKREEE